MTRILNVSPCTFSGVVLGLYWRKGGLNLFIIVSLNLLISSTIAQSEPRKTPKKTDSKMIPVRPGVFVQGSPKSELGRYTNERQVAVSLPHSFLMSATEVTQKRWLSLVDRNPSYFSNCGGQCPVDSVNWYEALEYANRKSEAEGFERCYILEGCVGELGSACGSSAQPVASCEGEYSCAFVQPVEGLCSGYRLPTESEWEYVARAGSTTVTYGDQARLKESQFARFVNNAQTKKNGLSCIDDSTLCAPGKVGMYAPSTWGHYDMHGNLREWVWDGFGEYGTGPQLDPRIDIGMERVIRGSSFRSPASDVRAALRGRLAPQFKNAEVGFRLVRTRMAPVETPTIRQPTKPRVPNEPKGAIPVGTPVQIKQ